MTHVLVECARRWDYIREGELQNHGIRVEAVQHWSGGEYGDSWCMEFVWFVVDQATKGKAPFDREQSVQSFREMAIAKGWQVAFPEEGDVVVSVKDGHGHHVGIVTQTLPLTSIAGNTDESGTSSNGTGVFEHAINPIGKEYFRLPLAA